ncbi:transglycosylase domain-containing protein [Corynebacterium caspium]|uniref:transglycosylase domain-containing protein n=1 Tax=Corynebacterium caspium TaxID=234828 RepID=UPI00036B244E|nr:transglycosylase domain-containing protein [Corynebacterium caspium]WKD60029.1 Penicillin-binding protein 1A [Corynebacterium caspium DSM 44850]
MAEDKKPKKRPASKRTSKRTVLLWSVITAFVLLIVLPIAGFLTAYAVVHIPEPEELTTKQVSQIFAADAETELARIVPPDGNRRQVEFQEIPEGVQNAVLAAEDREFWTNPGFSITGFGRAVIGQLTGNSAAGGGSTITQQYVKNTLVGNEHSIKRKLRELVYSAKMAQQWSKEDVLTAYLNTVYFGRNAYGIHAAAEAYFDKPVSELSTAEGAILAATIQLPSRLDPWANPEEAQKRWNYVMDGLVETGHLSPEERAATAYPETIDPASYSAYTEAVGTNGMIKNQVISELSELGISEIDVTTRGLRITTTIDPQAQHAAVTAVHEQLDGQPENVRTAAVSIEPASGAVRAYYGGEDANGWDFANAGLQTGSTFKIFTLAAALQQGIPLSTNYSAAPVTLPGNIEVTNVGTNGGTFTLAESLKRSLNTSFVRLQMDLENTTQDTADMAHALGIARSINGVPETLTENGKQPYEGIVLGQYQSRPFDMASALATLANSGVWHKPYFVERVETARGDVLYEAEHPAGERRINANVANNVLEAMGPIAAWSNNNGLADGRPSASKTGTTQLGDTGYNKDAWMIGATPQLATAVWVGTEDNSPLLTPWGGQVYGAGLPTQIWKQLMDGAHEGKEIRKFPEATPVTWGRGTFGSYDSTYQDKTEETEQETAPENSESVVPDAPVVPSAPAEDVEIAPGISIPGEWLNIF